MKKNIRFIGLDVHAETIAVAVAEGNGETRSLGVIPNRPQAVRRVVKKLGCITLPDVFETHRRIGRDGSLLMQRWVPDASRGVFEVYAGLFR